MGVPLAIERVGRWLDGHARGIDHARVVQANHRACRLSASCVSGLLALVSLCLLELLRHLWAAEVARHGRVSHLVIGGKATQRLPVCAATHKLAIGL